MIGWGRGRGSWIVEKLLTFALEIPLRCVVVRATWRLQYHAPHGALLPGVPPKQIINLSYCCVCVCR